MWSPGLIIAFFLIFILTVTESVHLLMNLRFIVKKKPEIKKKLYRPVTVVLSVRNEEKGIERCIRSLLNQNYAEFRIVVGDDSSTDRTWEIINSIQSDKLFTRKFTENEARGKAEILEKLCDSIHSGLIAVADGDTMYNPEWLKGLSRNLSDYSIVSGVTGVKDNAMQDMEWVTTLSRIRTATEMGFSTTAVGNNMMIEASVYKKVGGFGKVKNHITEDFALNREVVRSGYKSGIIYSPESLAITTGVGGKTFLYQRRRWMTGMSDISISLKILVLLYGILLPLGLYLVWVHPVGKYLISSFISIKIFSEYLAYRCIKKQTSLLRIFLFQFYQMFISLTMLFFFFVPGRNNWKGREWS